MLNAEAARHADVRPWSDAADATGVNPAGDAGDTPPNILVEGDVNGNIPANIITYFWI